MPTHVFTRWLRSVRKSLGRHTLIAVNERRNRRNDLFKQIRELVSAHYVDPTVRARRIESLGETKTAKLLREKLPTNKKSRSADMGEIFATEHAEFSLHYSVPVRRLCWKDGREMALRGDDLIGIKIHDTRLSLLKGEAKSRQSLSTRDIERADRALMASRGRPTRHSVLFVADRLRETGKDQLALALETAVLDSFRGTPVEHFLFVLSGNDPSQALSQHLTYISGRRRKCYGIGMRIDDHPAFIERLYNCF